MNQQFYTIMPSHVLVGPAIVDAILHECTCAACVAFSGIDGAACAMSSEHARSCYDYAVHKDFWKLIISCHRKGAFVWHVAQWKYMLGAKSAAILHRK